MGLSRQLITIGLAIAMALYAGGVSAVDVFMARPPNGNWNHDGVMPAGKLGLYHATVAVAWHDENGPDSNHMGARSFVWGAPGYTRYDDWAQGGNMIAEDGNDIPDGHEFSVLEYVYDTPSAPHHAAVKAALDWNINVFYTWTENGDPCSDAKPAGFPVPEGGGAWPSAETFPGYDWKLARPADFPIHLWNPGDGYNSGNPGASAWPHIQDGTTWKANPPWWGDRTGFITIYYGDTFANEVVPPNVWFASCSPTHPLILLMAAHATLSDEGVGPYTEITGKWSYYNYMRENPIDFTTDPRFDRSVVQFFGGHGDANGDGLTNKEKYESFMRAWNRTDTPWRPDGYSQLTAPQPSYLPRVQTDAQIGAYIDFLLYQDGLHPFDPLNVPPPPGFEVRVQASQWVAADQPLVLNARVTLAEETVLPLSYQWYKNGVALSDADPRCSGFDSATLTIAPPLDPEADSDLYWIEIVDSAETPAAITSAPSVVTVYPEGALPLAGMVGLGLLGGALALLARRRMRR